ncbi:hypothetical protein [Pseudactinotalea sp. Z1748]|uniref:hypothetical protein n=1 Tax=Pseudactinotalea sp. Z1748 TaxID=3413027 RepID=UPI003C7DFCB2
MADQVGALGRGALLDLQGLLVGGLGLLMAQFQLSGGVSLLRHRPLGAVVHEGGHDLGGIQALECLVGTAPEPVERGGPVHRVLDPAGAEENLKVPQPAVVAVGGGGQACDVLAGLEQFGVGSGGVIGGRAFLGLGRLEIDRGLVVQVGGDRGFLLGDLEAGRVRDQLHLEPGDLSGGVVNLGPGLLDVVLTGDLR